MKIQANEYAVDAVERVGWQYQYGFVRQSDDLNVNYPADIRLIEAVMEDARYGCPPSYEREISSIVEDKFSGLGIHVAVSHDPETGESDCALITSAGGKTEIPLSLARKLCSFLRENT